MTKGNILDGKPYEGIPLAQFDTEEVVLAAMPKRGSQVYNLMRVVASVVMTGVVMTVKAKEADAVDVHGTLSNISATISPNSTDAMTISSSNGENITGYAQMPQEFARHMMYAGSFSNVESLDSSVVVDTATISMPVRKSLLGNNPSDELDLEFANDQDRFDFFVLWEMGVPMSQYELRYRYANMNPILERDNSSPGDIWIFTGGSNWKDAKWVCITNRTGAVSTKLKPGKETFVICHGNLHSVHSKWIADMAVALRDRMSHDGKECNILAIDWGDEATAPMTPQQVTTLIRDGAMTASRLGINPVVGVEAAGVLLSNGLIPLYYPEFAVATALDIPDVAEKAYESLAHAFSSRSIDPSIVTLIGHSHGGHVTGCIAGHFARSGHKIGRLVGMETSNFASHWLVAPSQKFGRAWDGDSAMRTEFYKTSYGMSMGSTILDKDDQVFGHYNFFVVPKTDWKGEKAYFEWQLPVTGFTGGSNKAGNSYLMNFDADTDEGRLNAWRHDQVQEWFIETINEPEKWANLGYNWAAKQRPDQSARNLGMPDDLAVNYANKYHGVINWRTGKLEFAKPNDVDANEWRYREQILEGDKRTNGSPLDDLQNRVTQAIEYRVKEETVSIPEVIDSKNRTISFTVQNAADNESINYADVNKRWISSNNEAWGPWQKDLGIGFWLCRKPDKSLPDVNEFYAELTNSTGNCQFLRIKNVKIESLDEFILPTAEERAYTGDKAFKLNIPSHFYDDQIKKDGEKFLLVIGVGVSSKVGANDLPLNYMGDLCFSNNWYVKEVTVKPTKTLISINGNEYEDGETANLLIGAEQTSVPLTVDVVFDGSSLYNPQFAWSADTGRFAYSNQKLTKWTVAVHSEDDSKEATLEQRISGMNDKGESVDLEPIRVRVRLVRKKEDPKNVNQAVDYVILIDSTGSMSGAINSVKSNATRLIQEILSEDSRNCRVAVADYRDYPAYGGDSGDYPFRARCGFTTDPAVAISAVNGISVNGGGDAEESVYTALWECIKGTPLGGWRDEVRKAIIIMCDAGPHDPEPVTGFTASDIIEFANSMILDPLKDSSVAIIPSRAKSSARLSLKAASLLAASVGVSGHVGGVAIYPVLTSNSSSLKSMFDPLATETGGKVITSTDYSSVADAIAAIIEDVAIAADGFEYDVVNVNESAGSVTVRVYGGSKVAAASIDCLLVEGTAREGVDYVAPVDAVQHLSWANGERSYKTITIPICADTASSGDRFFSLVLINPVNMGLEGNNVCRINIEPSVTPVGDGRVYVKGVSQPLQSGYVVGSDFSVPGTVVHLKAISTEGNVFLSWDDGSTEAERDIDVTNATYRAEYGVATYVASFIPVSEITVPEIRSEGPAYVMAGTATYWELEYGSMVKAELSCSGLPEGLVFDHGVVTGMPKRVGCYPVTFTVKNRAGSATKTIDFNVIYKSAITTGGLYMVIDLSGGTNATHFSVTYLDAVPEGGWTDEYKTTKLVLRRIEAGTFMMGLHSNECVEAYNVGCAGYLHKVTLTKPFYEGVFEVTQKQWELVMGNNPSKYEGETRAVHNVAFTDIRGATKGIMYPITSEVDSASFIGILRAKTGLSRIDLPTEAQWEYACRAGTDTGLNNGKNVTVPSDYEHLTPSCPNFDEVGYYIANCQTNFHAVAYWRDSYGPRVVGSFKPNAWGLYDCHGNVAEWCLDHLEEGYPVRYQTDPVTDPLVMKEACDDRVCKGGGWWSYALVCVSGSYGSGKQTGSDMADEDGFRIVLNDADDTPMADVPMAGMASNVAATDGDFADKVEVTWESTGPDAMAFVYRGESEDDYMEFVGVSFGNSFSDTTTVEGTVYNYQVLRWNGGELSDVSNVDTGYCRRILNVPLSRIDCDYRAMTTNISIVANVPWRIQSDASWVKVPVGTGFGSRTFSCSINANTSPTNRYAQLLITSDAVDTNYVIKIEQESQIQLTIVDGVLTKVVSNGATELEIPSFVTNIAYRAFLPLPGEACASLRTVIIPDSVRGIEELAFWQCGIERIVIPGSVKNIGDSAFRDCTNLTEVIIKDGVEIIGNSAFSFCSKLERVEIPTSVKSIGSSAFQYCTALGQIEIPDAVREIGGFAFAYCGSLTNITFYGNAPKVGNFAFLGVPASCVTCVEYGSTGWDAAIPGQWNGMCIEYIGYTVAYEPGANGTGAEQKAKKIKNVSLKLVDALFTRTGYAQTGWTTSDGGAKVYDLGAPYLINATLTLYPFWTANTYSVGFDANGGEGTMDDQAFVFDEPRTLDRNAFTLQYHDFAGWATNETDEAIYADGAVVKNLTAIDGDVVRLFAKWTRQRAIVTVGDGVAVNLEAGLPYGDALPPAPTSGPVGCYFNGWYTGPDGTGRRVTAESLVEPGDSALYAYWVGNPYTVRFDANGGEGTMAEQPFAYGIAQKLAANAFTRKRYAFAGWARSADGAVEFANGQSVENLTTTSNGVVTLYAVWAMERPLLWTEVTGAAPAAAATYEGYLYDVNGNVQGTIQVKVGKPNAKTGLAAVKATVVGLDGKKKTLKATEKGKAQIAADGPTTVALTGGEACEVVLGAKGMTGTYGGSIIDGSLNVFTSKDAADKAIASAALGKWQGAVNVAWRLAEDGSPYQTLSVSIAAKGKAKVAGTLADGTKVSAKSQLIVGEAWCCVPVVYVKKGARLAFNVWLPLEMNGLAARSTSVVGLGEGVIVGKPETLKAGATFKLGDGMGDAKYEAYLPNGMAVGGFAKWTLPKAGKVQLAKDGAVDEAKLGENPSALKLTYKAKDGSFKGSFKVYADANGKPKATTVKVMGVLVNGTGYGAATVKGGLGVAVRVE